MCKSFGLRAKHLSVLFRIIDFIQYQNSTTSTIAEANLDVNVSALVNDLLVIRLKWSSDVVLFPCRVNSSQLQVRGFVYIVLLFCTSNQAQLSSNVHDVY